MVGQDGTSEAVSAVREYFSVTPVLFLLAVVCFGIGISGIRVHNMLGLSKRFRVHADLLYGVGPGLAVVVGALAISLLGGLLTLGVFILTVSLVIGVTMRVVVRLTEESSNY